VERQFAGDRWKETGYVFTSTIGTPLTDRNVPRDFHKLLEAAALPRRRFRDFRRACVSHAQEEAEDAGCLRVGTEPVLEPPSPGNASVLGSCDTSQHRFHSLDNLPKHTLGRFPCGTAQK
jgi:hypothetical protein